VRQPGGVDLHGERGGVRDQHVSVAVEDLSSRRRHRQGAHAVLRRGGHVPVGVQHLERPQPEQEDAEEHCGDDAERRRPQRKGDPVG
jgi:hypothetical protein